MRTTTFEPLFAASAATDAQAAQAAANTPAKSPLWARLFNQLIEVRQAQANAVVARHMALQDDKTLKALKWSDAEIADLRRKFGPAGR